MSAAGCPRTWQVEAARDGRLEQSALRSLRAHLRSCGACAHQHAALLELATELRASAPRDDEVQLRRVRQRLLAELDRQRLQAPTPLRKHARLLPVAVLAACALALLVRYVPAGLTPPASLAARNTPAPIALQLTAAGGAHFEHERHGELEYVLLHEGSLHIAFDRSLHARLTVRTPDGELEDFGTIFDVTVEHGRTERIRVEEGAVRFRRPGQPDLMLTAGQRFERAASEAPPTTSALPARPVAHSPSAATLHRHAPVTPSAEDQAYLEVLELLRSGRQAAARSAAQRYCRDFPAGLRVKELLPLASVAAPSSR